MRPCRCSVSTLEILVKDIAGIQIRQHQTQRFHLQHRTFAARPLLRRSELPKSPPVDDGFIPFQPEPSSADNARSHRDIDFPSATLIGDGDESWHAEVEIAASDVLATQHLDINASESVLDDTYVASEPVIATDAAQAPTRTRVENRLLRKTKRIDSGKHPLVNARGVKDKRSSEQRQQAIQERSEDSSVDPEVLWTDAPVLKLSKKSPGNKESADKSTTSRKRILLANTDGQAKAGVFQTISQTTKVQSGSAAKPPAVGQTRIKKKNMEAALSAEASKVEEKVNETQIEENDEESRGTKPEKEQWMIQKAALERKFGTQGWQPRKRVSPDTLEGIRALHASDPATYTTTTLSEQFEITPEAIRRILKSNWKPSSEEIEKRMKRWENRGLRKWEDMASQGVRPPKKWRDMGVQDPTKRINTSFEAPKARWARITETASRLPMEGSLAERIM